MAHYLQQETGAFRSVQSSDVTFGSSTVLPLQNFSAACNVNSTSTTTLWTAVPGATIGSSLLGGVGTWLVSATCHFLNTVSAQQWWCRITDGTTLISSGGTGPNAPGSIAFVVFSRGTMANPGDYDSISLVGICTNPTSSICLQYAPNSQSTTALVTISAGSGSTSQGPATQITAVRIG